MRRNTSLTFAMVVAVCGPAVLATSLSAQDRTTANTPSATLSTLPRRGGPLVLRGGTVHTAVGKPIPNGTVVIEGGKIVAVGANVTIPSNAQIVDVRGKDVIPGMIDNHSHIGAAPEDLNESAVSFVPQIRMTDGLVADDPAWASSLSGGVTTVVTGPGSSEVMSGEAVVIKTFGPDLNTRLLKSVGGLKIALGRHSLDRPPSTPMAVVAGLRALFVRAQEYMAAQQRWESGGKQGPSPPRDLGMEAVARVLRHEDYIRAHIHSAQDIMALLHLKDEFGFDLSLHHATDAYKVAGEIAKRHVSVVGMPLFVTFGVREETMKGPVILTKAGVLYAFHTDDPVIAGKWLRYSAAMGLHYGLTELQALQGVTINAAKIARVADRVGSLEPGKDADVVITNGPWYEPESRVDQVYVDGVLAYDRTSEPKSMNNARTN